jgi:hypothetical protein
MYSFDHYSVEGLASQRIYKKAEVRRRVKVPKWGEILVG